MNYSDPSGLNKDKEETKCKVVGADGTITEVPCQLGTVQVTANDGPIEMPDFDTLHDAIFGRPLLPMPADEIVPLPSNLGDRLANRAKKGDCSAALGRLINKAAEITGKKTKGKYRYREFV